MADKSIRCGYSLDLSKERRLESNDPDYSTERLLLEVFERVGKLTPRNRYLLLCALWQAFDLEREHESARKERRERKSP